MDNFKNLKRLNQKIRNYIYTTQNLHWKQGIRLENIEYIISIEKLDFAMTSAGFCKMTARGHVHRSRSRICIL